MAKASLTKRTIDAMQSEAKDYFVWDYGRVQGFGLKVTTKGNKIYVFQYRMRSAKRDRRITIGKHGAWTPEQARERATELRRMVDGGIDPFDEAERIANERKIESQNKIDKAITNVCDRWLDSYSINKGEKRRENSMKAARLVTDKLKAYFGDKRIDTIGWRDIEAFIDSIPAAKKATRRNSYAYSKLLWKWATRQELIDNDPFKTVEPPPNPKSRKRVLDKIELSHVWRGSYRLGYPFGPIVRLMILTGGRLNEIGRMSWSELDRNKRLWELPEERAKNKEANELPITDKMLIELDVIANGVNWPSTGFVFTTTGTTAVSGYSRVKRRLDRIVAELAGDELPPWVFHDLRRSFVTGLFGLSISERAAKAVINHKMATGSLEPYDRVEFAQLKLEGLNKWQSYIESLINPKPIDSGELVG